MIKTVDLEGVVSGMNCVLRLLYLGGRGGCFEEAIFILKFEEGERICY